VTCPLCSARRARRSCPALGRQICAICCGTKRLVEIQCPADCAYLASAREHPPASTVRRQQQDVEALLHHLRDFNRTQTELFFLIGAFLLRYEPPGLHSLLDVDVAEAAAALAGTSETATRGVIYEHRPASMPADRLATALKPVIAEAGRQLGSGFDRDAAVVLRRVEEAAAGGGVEHRQTGADASDRRAFLHLLARVMKERSESVDTGKGAEGSPGPSPRLIVE
jgi:hypothetical protein